MIIAQECPRLTAHETRHFASLVQHRNMLFYGGIFMLLCVAAWVLVFYKGISLAFLAFSGLGAITVASTVITMLGLWGLKGCSYDILSHEELKELSGIQLSKASSDFLVRMASESHGAIYFKDYLRAKQMHMFAANAKK